MTFPRALLVLDLEGTIFEPTIRLPGTTLASTVWPAIAMALGQEAQAEEIESHQRWEAHRQEQVAEIHCAKFVPQPYAAVYQDWSEDPFGGGWHAWKAGFRFWEIIKKMRKPLAGRAVYICGEAYSNKQGWVEGALQTTERMLEDHFSIPRPDAWLPAEYDLGP
jgi:hypothetical protein